MFSAHNEIEKPAFLNSFGLESVSENRSFRSNGLAWTVALTGAI